MRLHMTELEVDVLPVAWEHTGAEISDEFEYSETLDPYTDGLPAEIEAQLTERYIELLQLVLKHRDKIDRITLGGTHDGEPWINGCRVGGGTNCPLLFDRQRQPKTAYSGVVTLGRWL